MAGDDREPIGRKGKQPKRNQPRKAARRHRDDDYEEDEYQDEYDDEEYDDDEEEQRMPPKVKAKSPRKKRRWLGLLIKLFLVIAVLLAIYGVYLDSQIRSRIDGKVWQLPAAVYGRMVNLEPGMPYSKKEMVALLEGMQYRQVSRMTRPGSLPCRLTASRCCAARLISRMAKKARSTPASISKTIVWRKSSTWKISVTLASSASIHA